MDAKSEKTLPLKKAYPFAEQDGLAEEGARIRDMEISWDRPYVSSLRRGFMIELFQQHGLLSAFKEAHWPYGLTKAGEAEQRRSLKIKSQFDAYVGGTSSDEVAPSADDPEQDETEQFAMESHLRDFLAKNPERMEVGLRLYSTPENEGIEFPVDDGRIDLLAVDRRGKFVVIELKVSRGRNKALGQLLYYMGWVDKNLGSGPCRGIIIAKEITEDLVTAVSRVPGVTLHRYKMNFSVEEVSTGGDLTR